MTSYTPIGNFATLCVVDNFLLLGLVCVSLFFCSIILVRSDTVVAYEVQEHAALNFYAPGIHHPHGCAHEQSLPYSCDVYPRTGKIRYPADWSVTSDPWNNGSFDGEVAYREKVGGWTCPPSWKSLSGCADFLTRDQSTNCSNPRPVCNHSHRMFSTEAMPLASQYHVPFDFPIWYDRRDTTPQAFNSVTPPSIGRHREVWPKWGEYEFCPVQRWLHSAEHGAIVFLYNSCLDEHHVQTLRELIESYKSKSETFRYILSPFPNLKTNFGLVAWGTAMLSDCIYVPDWNDFVHSFYRRAWEDLSTDGHYDHLFIRY